jgi:IS30 family transposase
MRQVEQRLGRCWSPEQIAGRWRGVLYPAEPGHWISHSTIYRHVREVQSAGGTLHTFLRRYGNLRPKRYGSGPDGRGRIVGRVLIEERPKIVEAQGRMGDWEGDTLHGPDRKAHVATFVDRKSLYLRAATMADRTCTSLLGAARRCFETVPKHLRHTLTLDNGPEFRQFKGIEEALRLDVYFAHAYASWERPINENTNGLLRQYIAKKRPLHEVSSTELRHAVHALNHRPRKKLGYRTPHEVFRQTTVALDL